LLLLTGVLAIDRTSKAAALKFLADEHGIPVLPFFHLTYVENTGTIFGLMNGANAFFIVFTLVVLMFLGWQWRQLSEQRGGQAALSLITGGALGNLYDRVFLGHVIDFLDFRVWPVFNIADSCICIGAALLALGLLRPAKQDVQEKRQ